MKAVDDLPDELELPNVCLSFHFFLNVFEYSNFSFEKLSAFEGK